MYLLFVHLFLTMVATTSIASRIIRNARTSSSTSLTSSLTSLPFLLKPQHCFLFVLSGGMLGFADAALPADDAKDVVLPAVFRALLASARRTLNHVIKEIPVGSGTGVGLAHCLQLVREAEAHEIDDVEGVACILDALRSTSVDSPNAAKIFIRDVSIVIKDTVVLKCTCAVGHRNRDAFLAHLSQAFGRPLPCHLEAELLNSYEQNFTGLEGAFLSVT